MNLLSVVVSEEPRDGGGMSGGADDVDIARRMTIIQRYMHSNV